MPESAIMHRNDENQKYCFTQLGAASEKHITNALSRFQKHKFCVAYKSGDIYNKMMNCNRAECI